MLLFVTLVLLPLIVLWKTQNSKKAKGLALPAGSVRSIVALTIVGSYMIVLVIGGGVPDLKAHFAEIVSALTWITGAVVGFYFGSGGSGGTGKADTGKEKARMENEKAARKGSE